MVYNLVMEPARTNLKGHLHEISCHECSNPNPGYPCNQEIYSNSQLENGLIPIRRHSRAELL